MLKKINIQKSIIEESNFCSWTFTKRPFGFHIEVNTNGYGCVINDLYDMKLDKSGLKKNMALHSINNKFVKHEHINNFVVPLLKKANLPLKMTFETPTSS